MWFRIFVLFIKTGWILKSLTKLFNNSILKFPTAFDISRKCIFPPVHNPILILIINQIFKFSLRKPNFHRFIFVFYNSIKAFSEWDADGPLFTVSPREYDGAAINMQDIMKLNDNGIFEVGEGAPILIETGPDRLQLATLRPPPNQAILMTPSFCRANQGK